MYRWGSLAGVIRAISREGMRLARCTQGEGWMGRCAKVRWGHDFPKWLRYLAFVPVRAFVCLLRLCLNLWIFLSLHFMSSSKVAFVPDCVCFFFLIKCFLFLYISNFVFSSIYISVPVCVLVRLCRCLFVPMSNRVSVCLRLLASVSSRTRPCYSAAVSCLRVRVRLLMGAFVRACVCSC